MGKGGGGGGGRRGHYCTLMCQEKWDVCSWFHKIDRDVCIESTLCMSAWKQDILYGASEVGST